MTREAEVAALANMKKHGVQMHDFNDMAKLKATVPDLADMWIDKMKEKGLDKTVTPATLTGCCMTGASPAAACMTARDQTRSAQCCRSKGCRIWRATPRISIACTPQDFVWRDSPISSTTISPDRCTGG